MSQLVDLQDFIPSIQVDLKYATPDNFTGQKVYATPDNFTGQKVYAFERCQVLKEVALKLQGVQEELQKLGLGLKIWDGFRPIAAQVKFWELFPDERYEPIPVKFFVDFLDYFGRFLIHFGRVVYGV